VFVNDCQSLVSFPISRIAGGFAVFWRDAPPGPLVRFKPFIKQWAHWRQGNTMAISSIESVLQQMRVLAQTSGHPSAVSSEVAGGGFAGELKKSLDRISDAQQNASSQAEAFELGKPGVALNDVMVDLQKAGIGFQMGLQVRNRVVAAYQEIMNMPA
jgi:flagellar hook-basal body complex protein FliE